MTTSLSLHDLTFTWPDGSTVLDGLDLSVGPGRHGIVGVNGAGKSTLLRLIAGTLTPDRGTVSAEGVVGHLPQDPGCDPGRTVAEVLGIAEILAALDRMNHADVRESDFDLIGDDWDLPERTEAVLARLGLGALTLDRAVGTASGGELVLLSLAAQLLRRPSILLLDEPTSNLDLAARDRVSEALASYHGTLLVVSHDRPLLNAMDDIGDLRAGGITWFGGSYDQYESALAVEQEAATRAVRSAESDLKAQKRDVIEAQTKLARSARQGRQNAGSIPRIVAGRRKRAAQQTAGRVGGVHQDRVADAAGRLDAAERLVREDPQINVDLPGTAVPDHREVLDLTGVRTVHGTLSIDLHLRGPERVGITGANGSGKSTLLRTIAGELEPAAGTVQVRVPMRHLPQRMDLLDPSLTVAENIAGLAPEASEMDRRSRLARFGFRGRAADQRAATLSGGERLRATLACLLLAEPAPQLLLLDEPTNHLDLTSVATLVDALQSYRGALMVASHDLSFVESLGLTRRIEI